MLHIIRYYDKHGQQLNAVDITIDPKDRSDLHRNVREVLNDEYATVTSVDGSRLIFPPTAPVEAKRAVLSR